MNCLAGRLTANSCSEMVGLFDDPLDTAGAMATPFQSHGFVLSWTPGDPNGTNVAGPFRDASQDLLDLNLTKLGNTNYQMTVTRLVGGFANPIDAEIIGNRIYVLEYGGNQGLWEVYVSGGTADY